MSHVKIDFAIVGQPKSGTSALAQFLSEHPDVCMSLPKEPRYFADDIHKESDAFHGRRAYFPIRRPDDYDNCFEHCRAGQLRGEASPLYLHSTAAAKSIHRHNQSAKIIIMLRNPVDFVHSLHMQAVIGNSENEPDFAKALALEPERKAGQKLPDGVRYPSRLFYTDFAKYYEQVKRYFDTFPRRQILVLTHEEFRQDNTAAFRAVARFLGVNEDFAPDFKTVHGSQSPRFKTLNKLVHSSFVMNSAHKLLPPSGYDKASKLVHRVTRKPQARATMDPGLREHLRTLFTDDIRRTSGLLGRDFVAEWGLGSQKDR